MYKLLNIKYPHNCPACGRPIFGNNSCQCTNIKDPDTTDDTLSTDLH